MDDPDRRLVWYRRLAEVPGVDYPGSSRVDRRALPDHDKTPDADGWWSYGEEWTTQSPASRQMEWASMSESTPDGVLRKVETVLELPGEPSDYHFQIQSGIEALWKMRLKHPSALEDMEHLCHLDLRLIRSQPQIITNDIERDDGTTERYYFRVHAFQRLYELYSREGFLLDAKEIAEEAARFDQGESLVAQIEKRIGAVEAEVG